MEAEEGAGHGAGASKRRKSEACGTSWRSQTLLSGLRGWAAWAGAGASSWKLEACPTSSTVECHLSRLTDEHYGSPFNQLNLGHRNTMGGAFGSCREAEVPEPLHCTCTLRLFMGGAVSFFQPLWLCLLSLENLAPGSPYLERGRKRGT